MSSTVIGPRAFIRSVAQNSPVAVSEAGFTRFWSEWWWLFVKGFHVLEYTVLTISLMRAAKRPVLAVAQQLDCLSRRFGRLWKSGAFNRTHVHIDVRQSREANTGLPIFA